MRGKTDNLIEIEDLHFSYGTNHVLKGIQLAVPRGKVVGILGVSGAGKSTILRLIGGQLRPGKGHVRFDGDIVHELDDTGLYALRRNMGMMFQAGGLFSDISVYDNIAFPMRELTDLSEELIHDLVLLKLNAVGLRGASQLMPNELSGGMARRVALARAIALDPDIMLFDEPTTGLDPIMTAAIDQLIIETQKRFQMTCVVISHDIQSVFRIAHNIVMLYEGKIIEGGTPEVFRQSSNKIVQDFLLGRAPENSDKNC
ncbi:MAG TPA: ABC transporter ATP-binding protein [Syntrophobacteraceae bacterium]|nr:ABC transporter ATP-binding protein [Syntrophobacteraceae bacterium]